VFWAFASVLIVLNSMSPSEAQPVRVWKAIPSRPYVLRGTDRRLLDRAERFLADRQWDDAVAAVMRLLDKENSSVIAAGDQQYVSVSEHCHRFLANLPAEPLARYRKLVDATAESWYRQGIKARDSSLLQRVVDNYFCSHWGDDALFALGELALQRGEYQAARNAWRRVGRLKDSSNDELVYPGTDLSLAAVQARLVLVAIREGDWLGAEYELGRLGEIYPRAKGRLGGREVVFVERLTRLLKQARRGSVGVVETDWGTFASTELRTNSQINPTSVGAYEVLWARPIDNTDLSIFPVVVNGLVVYQDENSVRALNLAGGQEKFHARGKVFQSPVMPKGWLGQPRYSLTATDGYVFGVTTTPVGPQRRPSDTGVQSSLWSLDLQRDGSLALHLQSEDVGVAFVGAPVVDATCVYVPIRSNAQTARAGIACYDLSTGERNWQRWICQANTPATGWTNEIVCNSLTYDAGLLYINTNLGAVAAVRANDGQISWLRTYERQSAELDIEGKCAYYRGPNPCVYHLGMIFVLPTDGKALLALDATTGAQLWRYLVSDPHAQLIGVTGDRVVLSNHDLQALECRTGELAGEVPTETPYGGINVPEAGNANLLVSSKSLITAAPSQISAYSYQPREKDTSTESQHGRKAPIKKN